MNRFLNISLYLIVSLFLILYFTLSFHSRLAGDDFFYLWLKNTFGAWNGMLYQYGEWSGRWTAHSIGCALLSWWKLPVFLPVINGLTILMLYVSIRMSLKKIFHYLNIENRGKIIQSFTLLLCVSFFFSSYSIGETWFWYIIILTYLWSIIAFIFLLNFISTQKNNFITLSLITLFSVYIGGASESYALLFIFILFVLLIYRRFVLNINLSEGINTKLFFSLIILLISFSFNAFAPGTEIRHSLLPHTSLAEKSWIAGKAFLKFFVRYLPEKIFYLILFSWPWFYLGYNNLKSRFNADYLNTIVRNVSFIYLIILAIFFIPTTFVMSEIGPDRALSIVSLLTVIYFSFLFTVAGIFTSTKPSFIRVILSLLTIVTILFLGFQILTQYSITNNFADAYDERMKNITIAEENNFNGTLELKKMPPSGMLYWDELSPDTSYYTNKHLKDGLNLKFQVKLKIE